jgi:hypothetical protein
MKKIDYKKELKEHYNPSKKAPELVTIPERNFIMIDGLGNPNTSSEFQNSVEALYSVSYNLKFMVKKGKMEIDYGVMPLEGIWWCDDMNDFSVYNKGIWKWSLMIMQPEFITKVMFEEAVKEVKEKKKIEKVGKLSFKGFKEGLSVQMMHIGPFSTEPETLKKMESFMAEEGFVKTAKHHEIYLNDFRKIAPEKMKTILRQPVKRG